MVGSSLRYGPCVGSRSDLHHIAAKFCAILLGNLISPMRTTASGSSRLLKHRDGLRLAMSEANAKSVLACTGRVVKPDQIVNADMIVPPGLVLRSADFRFPPRCPRRRKRHRRASSRWVRPFLWATDDGSSAWWPVPYRRLLGACANPWLRVSTASRCCDWKTIGCGTLCRCWCRKLPLRRRDIYTSPAPTHCRIDVFKPTLLSCGVLHAVVGPYVEAARDGWHARGILSRRVSPITSILDRAAGLSEVLPRAKSAGADVARLPETCSKQSARSAVR